MKAKFESILTNLLGGPSLVDTHAHLHWPDFNEHLELILTDSKKRDLSAIWLVSVEQLSMKRNLAICEQWQTAESGPRLHLGVGFDPEILIPGSEFHDPQLLELAPTELKSWALRELEQALEQATAHGIAVELVGEIGLDQYWLAQGLATGQTTAGLAARSFELQQTLFEFQLKFAAELGLPVSIHSRGAERECIDMVRKIQTKYSQVCHGIFHSFTGSIEECAAVLDLEGFCIGLNGIVTYKSARELCEFVRSKASLTANMTAKQGLEALHAAGFVLESDAPYLIPANSKRELLPISEGRKLNVPGNVADVLKWLLAD